MQQSQSSVESSKISHNTTKDRQKSGVFSLKNAKGEWQVDRYHGGNLIPESGWIWVFGSNLAGRHNAGCEKIARVNFRAEYGVGAGPTGTAYAIAIKDKHLKPVASEFVRCCVTDFLNYAREFPKLRFFVSKFSLPDTEDSVIAQWFLNAPQNCSLPQEWKISSNFSSASTANQPSIVQ